MPRQRRAFSPEFKLRVGQEVESGQSQASVARKYELSPHLIPLWKKALQAGRLGGHATGIRSRLAARDCADLPPPKTQEKIREILAFIISRYC